MAGQAQEARARHDMEDSQEEQTGTRACSVGLGGGLVQRQVTAPGRQKDKKDVKNNMQSSPPEYNLEDVLVEGHNLPSW